MCAEGWMYIVLKIDFNIFQCGVSVGTSMYKVSENLL